MRRKPACCRLLALTAAIVVLLAAPLAHAAVPICDELAQTIAAPPPVMPLKAGAISQLHCPHSDPFTVGAPAPPEAPRQLSAPDLPDRMCSPSQGFPPCPRHELVPVIGTDEGELPGYHASVYRPPRAA